MPTGSKTTVTSRTDDVIPFMIAVHIPRTQTLEERIGVLFDVTLRFPAIIPVGDYYKSKQAYWLPQQHPLRINVSRKNNPGPRAQMIEPQKHCRDSISIHGDGKKL